MPTSSCKIKPLIRKISSHIKYPLQTKSTSTEEIFTNDVGTNTTKWRTFVTIRQESLDAIAVNSADALVDSTVNKSDIAKLESSTDDKPGVSHKISNVLVKSSKIPVALSTNKISHPVSTNIKLFGKKTMSDEASGKLMVTTGNQKEDSSLNTTLNKSSSSNNIVDTIGSIVDVNIDQLNSLNRDLGLTSVFPDTYPRSIYSSIQSVFLSIPTVTSPTNTTVQLRQRSLTNAAISNLASSSNRGNEITPQSSNKYNDVSTSISIDKTNKSTGESSTESKPYTTTETNDKLSATESKSSDFLSVSSNTSIGVPSSLDGKKTDNLFKNISYIGSNTADLFSQELLSIYPNLSIEVQTTTSADRNIQALFNTALNLCQIHKLPNFSGTSVTKLSSIYFPETKAEVLKTNTDQKSVCDIMTHKLSVDPDQEIHNFEVDNKVASTSTYEEFDTELIRSMSEPLIVDVNVQTLSPEDSITDSDTNFVTNSINTQDNNLLGTDFKAIVPENNVTKESKQCSKCTMSNLRYLNRTVSSESLNSENSYKTPCKFRSESKLNSSKISFVSILSKSSSARSEKRKSVRFIDENVNTDKLGHRGKAIKLHTLGNIMDFDEIYDITSKNITSGFKEKTSDDTIEKDAEAQMSCSYATTTTDEISPVFNAIKLGSENEMVDMGSTLKHQQLYLIPFMSDEVSPYFEDTYKIVDTAVCDKSKEVQSVKDASQLVSDLKSINNIDPCNLVDNSTSTSTIDTDKESDMTEHPNRCIINQHDTSVTGSSDDEIELNTQKITNNEYISPDMIQTDFVNNDMQTCTEKCITNESGMDHTSYDTVEASSINSSDTSFHTLDKITVSSNTNIHCHNFDNHCTDTVSTGSFTGTETSSFQTIKSDKLSSDEETFEDSLDIDKFHAITENTSTDSRDTLIFELNVATTNEETKKKLDDKVSSASKSSIIRLLDYSRTNLRKYIFGFTDKSHPKTHIEIENSGESANVKTSNNSTDDSTTINSNNHQMITPKSSMLDSLTEANIYPETSKRSVSVEICSYDNNSEIISAKTDKILVSSGTNTDKLSLDTTASIENFLTSSSVNKIRSISTLLKPDVNVSYLERMSNILPEPYKLFDVGRTKNENSVSFSRDTSIVFCKDSGKLSPIASICSCTESNTDKKLFSSCSINTDISLSSNSIGVNTSKTNVHNILLASAGTNTDNCFTGLLSDSVINVLKAYKNSSKKKPVTSVNANTEKILHFDIKDTAKLSTSKKESNEKLNTSESSDNLSLNEEKGLSQNLDGSMCTNSNCITVNSPFNINEESNSSSNSSAEEHFANSGNTGTETSSVLSPNISKVPTNHLVDTAKLSTKFIITAAENLYNLPPDSNIDTGLNIYPKIDDLISKGTIVGDSINHSPVDSAETDLNINKVLICADNTADMPPFDRFIHLADYEDKNLESFSSIPPEDNADTRLTMYSKSDSSERSVEKLFVVHPSNKLYVHPDIDKLVNSCDTKINDLLNTSLEINRKYKCIYKNLDTLVESHDRVSEESSNHPSEDSNDARSSVYTNIDHIRNSNNTIAEDILNASFKTNAAIAEYIRPSIKNYSDSDASGMQHSLNTKYSDETKASSIENESFFTGVPSFISREESAISNTNTTSLCLPGTNVSSTVSHERFPQSCKSTIDANTNLANAFPIAKIRVCPGGSQEKSLSTENISISESSTNEISVKTLNPTISAASTYDELTNNYSSYNTSLSPSLSGDTVYTDYTNDSTSTDSSFSTSTSSSSQSNDSEHSHDLYSTKSVQTTKVNEQK